MAAISPAAAAVKALYLSGTPPPVVKSLEDHSAAIYSAQSDKVKYALMRYKSDSKWVRQKYARTRRTTHMYREWDADLSNLISQFGPLKNWVYVCHGYNVPKVLPVSIREHRSEMVVGDIIDSLAASYISTTLNTPGIGCTIACPFSEKRHVILHLFLPPGVRAFYMGGKVDELMVNDLATGGARFTGPGLFTEEESAGMPVGEMELLLERGYTFEIIGIYPDRAEGKYFDELAPICPDYRLHIYARAIVH